MLRLLLCLGVLLSITAVSARAAGGRPDFETIVREHAQETIEIRRWLHRHAELSLREFETQKWVRARLEEIPGVEMVPGEWGTGLVAILKGGLPGPVVAYRADMDALPIVEKTGLPFACAATDTLGGSTVGVMHACGHDMHMALLIATARALSEVRLQMPGAVLFVLEPGEEIGAGAFGLIQAGVFDGARRPEAIYAIHVHPTLLPHQIGYCPGQSTANVDEARIRVLGRGGHGAYPHKAIDPVVLASQMVLGFQSIVSREVNANDSAVITVGAIHGGASSNVIPEFVDLRATVRTLTPDTRALVQAAILRTAKGIAEAGGAPEPEITYILGTPAMYNDPNLVEETLPGLRRAAGEDNVIRYEPALGGEDFSEYQKVVPGFMFRLGVGRAAREMANHSASFDPDENALALGVRAMCEILWDRLARQGM
jgi:amidohydrolase